MDDVPIKLNRDFPSWIYRTGSILMHLFQTSGPYYTPGPRGSASAISVSCMCRIYLNCNPNNKNGSSLPSYPNWWIGISGFMHILVAPCQDAFKFYTPVVLLACLSWWVLSIYAQPLLPYGRTKLPQDRMRTRRLICRSHNTLAAWDNT
jgi:hypothetical protein